MISSKMGKSRAAALAVLVIASCSSDKARVVDAGATADGNSLHDAAVSDATKSDGAVVADAQPSAGDASTLVSFQTDVMPIVGGCGGELCHGGLASPSWPYATLVNQPTDECSDGRLIVKPGDPTNSYLVQKLKGIDMCSGVRMPKFGAALADADIETIATWISQGALNN